MPRPSVVVGTAPKVEGSPWLFPQPDPDAPPPVPDPEAPEPAVEPTPPAAPVDTTQDGATP